tara:strand:+ start:479 stop:1072 length:594 start_codon:yes stop_codon:yes gene_type:complete
MNEFINKNIIIVGPSLNQPKNDFLQKYDIVIRTNNFINSDLYNLRCDALLLNYITARVIDVKSLYKIYKSNIKYIICYHDYYLKFKKYLPNKKIIIINIKNKTNRINYIYKKHPTIIYILIMNLLDYNIRSLFIDGIDFYTNKKIYIDGYKWSIHNKKESIHNINEDKSFLILLLHNIKNINTTLYIFNILKKFLSK